MQLAVHVLSGLFPRLGMLLMVGRLVGWRSDLQRGASRLPAAESGIGFAAGSDVFVKGSTLAGWQHLELLH